MPNKISYEFSRNIQFAVENKEGETWFFQEL